MSRIKRGRSPHAPATLRSEDAYVKDLLQKQIKALGVAYAKKEALHYDIPVSIFTHHKLSPFESLCKYLSDQGLNAAAVSRLLAKPYPDVYQTARNARRKDPSAQDLSGDRIPLSELVFDLWTINEALVVYLREKTKLEFNQIARILMRDRRNIWTIYQRAVAKRLGGVA